MFNLPNNFLGKKLKVAVLGCGGTGYWVSTQLLMLQRILENLGSSFDSITLYDPKDIRSSNLARTGFLSHEVGFNKGEILAQKLNMALGYSLFKGIAEKANFSGVCHYDLIITATDNKASRLMLNQLNRQYNSALWLDLGVDKATASAVLGSLCSKNALPTSLELFPLTSEKEDHIEPSCDMQTSLARQAFGVNQTIAMQGVNLIAQLLLDGEIKYHGVLLDMKSGYTTPITPAMYPALGYTCAA